MAAEGIETLIGPLARPTAADESLPQGGAQKSPGMLERHYAPGLPLRMNAAPGDAGAGEAVLAFGPDAPAPGEENAPGDTMNLSPTGDLEEAAANLFSMIRALDGPPFTGIAVMPVPDIGLGRAINDRLRRATQPAAD